MRTDWARRSPANCAPKLSAAAAPGAWLERGGAAPPGPGSRAGGEGPWGREARGAAAPRGDLGRGAPVAPGRGMVSGGLACPPRSLLAPEGVRLGERRGAAGWRGDCGGREASAPGQSCGGDAEASEVPRRGKGPAGGGKGLGPSAGSRDPDPPIVLWLASLPPCYPDGSPRVGVVVCLGEALVGGPVSESTALRCWGAGELASVSSSDTLE